MPAEFDAEEILNITQGRLAQGMMPDGAGTIEVDSRRLQPGQWFFALCGTTFDGHDFIGDAFAQEALGCVVEERGNYPIASTSFALIAVDDTEEALGLLAANWRKRLRRKIVVRLATGPGALDALSVILWERLADGFKAKGQEAAQLNWKMNVSEILVDFLSLDDEIGLIFADLAPVPDSKLDFVLQKLRPDVVLYSSVFAGPTGSGAREIDLDAMSLDAAYDAMIDALKI